MSKKVEVKCPVLGESVTDATLSARFVEVGSYVAQDEMLCELETDKVTVEVPSPVCGIVDEFLVPDLATITPDQSLVSIVVPDHVVEVPFSLAPSPNGKYRSAHWFRKEGDRVLQGEPLCTVQTGDGLPMISAPVTGYVARTYSHVGEVSGDYPVAILTSSEIRTPIDILEPLADSTGSKSSENLNFNQEPASDEAKVFTFPPADALRERSILDSFPDGDRAHIPILDWSREADLASQLAKPSNEISIRFEGRSSRDFKTVSKDNFNVVVGQNVRVGQLICRFNDRIFQVTPRFVRFPIDGKVVQVMPADKHGNRNFSGTGELCVVKRLNTHQSVGRAFEETLVELETQHNRHKDAIQRYQKVTAQAQKVLSSAKDQVTHLEKQSGELQDELQKHASEASILKENPLSMKRPDDVLAELLSRLSACQWSDLAEGVQSDLVKIFETIQTNVSKSQSQKVAHLEEFKALMEMYDAKIRVARANPLDDEDLQEELVDTWKLLRDREIAAIEGD